MATEILMPQMGESIAEGTVTRWLVEVGESVERDQPVLEISTDKVDAEIPAPSSGVLLEKRCAEGDTVPVNEVVGLLGAEGEEPSAAPAGDSSPAAAASASDAAGAATGASDGASDGASNDGGGSEESDEATSLEERLRTKSSPVVRKIAAEEDVDIAEVEGTGIHGRVTKKDILGYLEARAEGRLPSRPTPSRPTPSTPSASAPAASAATPTPSQRPTPSGFSVPAYHPGENVTLEPMSRMRQRTSDHMVYSKATSAHVTTVFHVDMSRVARLRARAKSKFQAQNGTKLTYMPFIFRAVCDGIKAHPQLNAAIDGSTIVYKNDINLGMAVALDGGGLIVPVLHKADDKSLIGLARTANDLADRARAKKLKPEEAAGGTFTITNPGVFGSLFGTPVISQPQVAILGIGAIEKRPIVQTDADGIDSIAIRTMCYFALTFDHRLIDGADADAFMNVLKATLETGEWSELQPYL